MLIADFPALVKAYGPRFESCFSPEGYQHFKKLISGFLMGENKTISGINRLFMFDIRDQSCMNRFCNRQNFDLEEINTRRLAMLDSQASTSYTTMDATGVLVIDNSLLTHYGQHFDKIHKLYNYVSSGYAWSHDLVTLQYSSSSTDYPLSWELWTPPDWVAIGAALKERNYVVNKDKWDARETEPKEYINYIRSRFSKKRDKDETLTEVYKMKTDIGADLLRDFFKKNPNLNYPIALDIGFTSNRLCEKVIVEELKQDYVGQLRMDQTMFNKQGEKQKLEKFVEQCKSKHFCQDEKPLFKKIGYKYKGKKYYEYVFATTCSINKFKKKQRVLICFSKEDLSDTPRIVITNRRNWYPTKILKIRKHRWPIESYHQEAKAEGIDKYQVRNFKAIETHIAFIVLTYSMLKYAQYDHDLLNKLQERLHLETDGTLPFLRRLMKAEGLVILIEYLLLIAREGENLSDVLLPYLHQIAYK